MDVGSWRQIRDSHDPGVVGVPGRVTQKMHGKPTSARLTINPDFVDLGRAGGTSDLVGFSQRFADLIG